MKARRLAKFRFNLWFYFVLYTLIIVAFMWVFEIVLYETLYQREKFNDLTDMGEELSGKLNHEGNIDGNVINDWLNSAIAANEAGISSYLVRIGDNDEMIIETIYSGYVNSDLTKLDTGEISLDTVGGPAQSSSSSEAPDSSSAQDPISSSGDSGSDEQSSSETISLIESKGPVISDAISRFSKAQNDYISYIYGEDPDTYLVYVTKAKNVFFDGYLVMMTTEQTLRENVKVIQLQLIIVSIVVIIVGFFLSMYISSRVSKPLANMSKTAKSWAEGDETGDFETDSYQELDELAEALNYAKNGLAQTGVLQRDLLANVSHDLKTPLTMIKAYAEMIRDISGDDRKKREQHTEVIIDEADRLTMLVNDILDLSKLQNGMNSLELKRINLSELLKKVVSRFKDFAENSGYKIITEVTDDLFTVCDEKKIEQVLYNLIGNSINYTGDDKTINVSLSLNEKTVLFETIDSGKGISEDKINTIWDKYYRFSETHQRPIKGTGLGLSIVKTILDNHRLKYGVISKKGMGSNFFVEFILSENE